MGLTHFPHGVASFGIPIIGSGEILTTGNVFFVSSASANARDDASHGSDPSTPFATLDYAIGRCTADNGDHIILMPNHAETITGASGITADVAGITIVGLGNYNQRPRFLMDGGTTVDLVVSAADVALRNIVFAAGHADIVRCINTLAVGTWLDRLEFVNNVVDENFLTPIKSSSTTDGAANGLKVTNCRGLTADAAAVEFIELNADVIDFVAKGNVYISEGTASPLVLCATGKDLKQCDIQWNYISHKATSGNLFISNDTASPNNSGIIAHNRCRHADVTGAHTMGAVGGCGFFDNLSASTDAVSGFVLPAIDVDL